MKTLLLSLLLLVGFTANATYIPTQDTITIAGKTITRTDLKTLYFTVSGANGWSTAREQGASAGYTPSGANKFRIVGIKIRISTAGTLSYQQADNDSGVSTTTASVNPVYNGGDADLSYVVYGGGFASGREFELLTDFQIANGKYLTFTGDGTCIMFGEVYGYEEP